ncbi:MAG: DJ-1/PfpI family protein [Mycoplasma sp.]|nr:DJ-1/PfpI family protein [Mycoplasma sp.]
MKHKILVVALNDFEPTELITPINIFRRGGVEFDLFSPEGNKKITSVLKSVILENVKTEVNFDDYDSVFLPGGPSINRLKDNHELFDFLQNFKEKEIFAICDGPNLLYKLKIITDQEYTAYPSEWSEKGKNYFLRRGIVDYKNLLTAKSFYYSRDFGLKIIEKISEKMEVRKIVKNAI